MDSNINDMADDLSEVLKNQFEITESEAKAIVYKYINELPNKGASSADFKTFQSRLEKDIKKELTNKLNQRTDIIKDNVESSKKLRKWDTTATLVLIGVMTKKLIDTAFKEYKKNVITISKIDRKFAKANSKLDKGELRLKRNDNLKKTIFSETQKGIDQQMRVKTPNQGTWGYKEFMETRVRANAQSEISKQQLDNNAAANVVFYVCNVFSDCADDHKAYQGKYYYDKRWTSFKLNKETKEKIATRIGSLSMLSIQEVREGDPWLTTRPNCRHTFHPVDIKEVITKHPLTVVREQKLTTGKYKQRNYEVTQIQRHYERQIRYYKRRANLNEKLYKDTKDKRYLTQSAKDKTLVTKWSRAYNDFVKKENVKRDYRRSSPSTIWTDLGAKYNT